MFSETLPAATRRNAVNDATDLVKGAFLRMLMPPLLSRLPTPGNRRYHRARNRLQQTLGGLVTARRAAALCLMPS
jgi:hypothetical protein